MYKEIEKDDKKIISDLEKRIKSFKDIKLKKKSVLLHQIFKKLIKIENNYYLEKKKKTDEYNANTEKITTESDQIIEGKKDIDELLIKNWIKDKEKDFFYQPSDLQKKELKDFWLNFILNNNIYNGVDDEEILLHLKKVEIINKTDANDDFLKMTDFICYFSENKYFDNKMLKASLFYEGDQIMASSGTLITWKINPTLKNVKKIQINKRTKKKRTVVKKVKKRTFFEIFDNFQLDDHYVNKSMDEDAPIMNLLSLDECVKIFVDCMPYALEYYLDIEKDQELEPINEVDNEEEEN